MGQALCSYILTRKGTVIARSSVSKLENPNDPPVLRELETFNADVRGELANGTVIQRKSAAERATEAQKFARTDDEDSQIGRN